jgi:hypothetical protein
VLVIFLWFYAEAWERGWLWRLSVVPACAALVSIRPNGWIVPPALTAHAVLTAGRWRWPARAAALAGLAAVLLGVAFGLSGLRRGIEAESPVQMLYRGEVLWGHAPWRLQMPAPETTSDAWLPAVGYVARHPVACTRLALTRVAVLFGRVRPSYSARHNLFLLCAYPPLYALALWGFWRARRRREAGILAAVIAGHVLTVALTFDHVDGRFFLYFAPELVLFSAVGAAGVLKAAGWLPSAAEGGGPERT